jgi:hypothetical protein
MSALENGDYLLDHLQVKRPVTTPGDFKFHSVLNTVGNWKKLLVSHCVTHFVRMGSWSELYVLSQTTYSLQSSVCQIEVNISYLDRGNYIDNQMYIKDNIKHLDYFTVTTRD